ncbi:MAG: MFS transporter [Desulfobacterales bacterium]
MFWQKEKTRYGRLRAWGSLSFVMVVIITGRIIDAFFNRHHHCDDSGRFPDTFVYFCRCSAGEKRPHI